MRAKPIIEYTNAQTNESFRMALEKRAFPPAINKTLFRFNHTQTPKKETYDVSECDSGNEVSERVSKRVNVLSHKKTNKCWTGRRFIILPVSIKQKEKPLLSTFIAFRRNRVLFHCFKVATVFYCFFPTSSCCRAIAFMLLLRSVASVMITFHVWVWPRAFCCLLETSSQHLFLRLVINNNNERDKEDDGKTKAKKRKHLSDLSILTA